MAENDKCVCHDHDLEEGGPIGCGSPLDVSITCGGVAGLKPIASRERAIVSASGQVMRGEFIRRVGEYASAGDELRWGQGDVHVLDATELSQGRVGVVFTQGEATKFKILALTGGTLALGNTLTLVEDEAVEDARVIEMPGNQALVVYNQDAAGMAAVISLADRAATLAYADIWDDHNPENLCVCRLGGANVLFAGTRSSGEAWARMATVTDTRLLLGTALRVDGNNDVDVYAGAWALCGVTDSTAVLLYPQALDKPVGFAVLDVDPENDRNLIIRCYGQGKYAASLPTVAAVPLDGGRWAMAYGIGWLSSDKQVVKSTLALEVWGLTRYAVELMWYGCEDTQYDASIGAVGLEANGVGLACSYTGNDEGRSILLGMLDGPSPGPAVPLGPHNGFCRVVPISVQKALLVTQRDGNGYVQEWDAVERVIPADTLAHGLALSGGGPNKEISVALMRS